MSEDKGVHQEQIEKLQGTVLGKMAYAFDRMTEAAEIEGTPAAWAKVLELGLKIVPGLQVKEKSDPYANLPTINVIFDGGINSEPMKVVDAEVLEITTAADSDAGEGEEQQPAEPESTESPPADEALPDIDLDELFDFQDAKVDE